MAQCRIMACCPLMCWPYHCCRPVDCTTRTALPLEPGFVDKTIYKDQLASGWGVGTGGSTVRRLQQSQNGLSGSNASCFDLQTEKVSNYVTMSLRHHQLPCPALPCPALPYPILPCPALSLPCPAPYLPRLSSCLAPPTQAGMMN